MVVGTNKYLEAIEKLKNDFNDKMLHIEENN
jgi:hypothetical protein